MPPEVSEGVGLPDRQAVLGERNGPSAWFQYALVRLGVGTLSRLPDGPRDALLSMLAGVARRFDARHADPAREFLTTALGELEPERREELVRGAFQHLASVAIDSVRRDRWKGDPLEHYQVEPCPRMRELMVDPQPVVFVTAHVGDWEASTLGIAALGFRPLYVVAKPPKNRPLSAWMQRRRETDGVHLLSRYGAVEGARKVITAGGSIGFLLDHRATQRPVLAPFFGRPALCERTSGVLLRRLKRPVAMVGCYRTEDPLRYRLVFPRVFEPEELASQSPDEIATLINQELEKLILAAPEQYHWLHDRYRGVAKFQRKLAEREAARQGVAEGAS